MGGFLSHSMDSAILGDPGADRGAVGAGKQCGERKTTAELKGVGRKEFVRGGTVAELADFYKLNYQSDGARTAFWILYVPNPRQRISLLVLLFHQDSSSEANAS